MKVLTPKFRASYPNVFKAVSNKLSKKMEYSVVALFPKGADLSGLKKAAKDACIEKWGADETKWPKNLESPFKDQGDRAKDGVLPQGYEKGAIYMNLKNKNKPGVVDQNVQPIIDESEFYPGCWAIASVNCFAWDYEGVKFGVSFGLNNIQKVKDGEPFSGRTKAEDDFAPVATEDGETAQSAESLF